MRSSGMGGGGYLLQTGGLSVQAACKHPLMIHTLEVRKFVTANLGMLKTAVHEED